MEDVPPHSNQKAALSGKIMGLASAWCFLDKQNEANLHRRLNCVAAEANCKVSICHQIQRFGFACVISSEDGAHS